MKTISPAFPSTLTAARPFPPHSAFRWLAVLASLTLPFAGVLRADAPPTIVHLAPAGTDTEGLRTFRLEWNAFPNAAYLLESTDKLGPGSQWHLFDAVIPATVLGSFPITVPSADTSGFYRLGLPQPEISSVEPARFSSDAAVDAWMTGQCFASTDIVRVDGVAVSGVVFVSNSLLRFTLPPSSAGTHLVELMHGGVAVSSFTVTNTGGVASGTLALQGPPDAPPASPQIASREFKFENTGDVTTGPINRFVLKNNGGVATTSINVSLNRIFKPTPDKVEAGAEGIRCFSGEVSQQICDLAIEGRGLDFIWARTYSKSRSR